MRIAVALAEAGRGGEVRFFSEIDTTDAATRKLVTRLEAKYSQLIFCYEAGPTGYGLYRLLTTQRPRRHCDGAKPVPALARKCLGVH